MIDKFQAAFEILYIASAIDGDVNNSEIDIINEFIESNDANINFSTRDIIDDISMLNLDGIVDEFIKSAEAYVKQSDVSEKRILLNFFMTLIISDGEIGDNEMKLFLILTEVFNIDSDKFIENYFND
jgi:hypothetical protein